jgi:ATP-dependent Clp protease ATP-binding subunit ClpB
VVLFDEIEKAHPEVFDVLLQILDDGRLTDGQGHTVDFRHTVLIMTSNLGGQWILELGEHDWGEAERRVLDTMRDHFKPEFLNRVDDVIVFRPLSRDDLGQIIDLQLEHVARLLQARGLRIEVSPDAKALLVDEGFDPVYGARPLKRVIQRRVQNRLAMALLEGEYSEGDLVRVIRSDEALGFERVSAGPPE